MSLHIDIGLFKFDFTDCHAVLGVPIDADFKDIRQQYLKIARRLHPDSTAAKGEVEKQRANDLFSKIVNPAYEKFTTERSRAEYLVLLKDISRRVRQEQNPPPLQHELSQELAKTNNVEHIYKIALHKLTPNQYQDLEQVTQIIAQISELNLVYLMRQAHKAFISGSQPFPSSIQKPPEESKTPPPPPDTPAQETLVDQYLRRAQKLMEKNNFPHARVELQDALKLEPNNTIAHSLMGIVYLKQSQLTMARVHINKALQLDPTEPMALRSKQVLAEATPEIEGQTNSNRTTDSSDKPKGGGLFGGLFGGKKNK